jgi:tetratricopeptide (TPR) repeat protein
MRLWAFRAILVVTPLLLLLLGEAALRLVPGSGYPPLVVTLARDGDDVLFSTNAVFPERFFQERLEGALVASGRMRAEPFREDGAYRVVVAGASSVQGYPHPHRLAYPALLEAMLADARQGAVRVFNLGITSIASFAVARTVDEALALRPQAVVLYTGHNEFYGLFGAGAGDHAALRYELMAWRLPRLLQRLIDTARGQEVSSAQLLETMARRGTIAPGDPRRAAAASALERHLVEAVTRLRQAGVRPVLCTLASNLEDFAPAASVLADSTTAEGRRWWAAVEAARRDLEKEGGAAQALARLDSVRAIQPDAAWAVYLEGRALRRLGRHDEADSALVRARELDTMPWRAPQEHNRVIRRVAARHDVDLVDAEALFAEASAPTLPGWEWMVDHVHPTVNGQALLAAATARVLLGGAAASQLGERDVYIRRQGWIPVEAVRVDQGMAELLGSPPMDRFHRDEAQLFRRRAAERWTRLSPAEQRGAERWMSHRETTPLALEVADQLYQDRHFDRALAHYRASRLEAPYTPRGDLWAAVQIGWCADLSGLPADAIDDELTEALERTRFVAQAPDVDPAFVDFVRGSLHHFLGQAQPALAHLERAFGDAGFRRRFLYSLFPPLAERLVEAGRVDEARRFAALASSETDGSPYFGQLVATLERDMP